MPTAGDGEKRSVVIRNIGTVELAVATLEEMLISQNQRDR